MLPLFGLKAMESPYNPNQIRTEPAMLNHVFMPACQWFNFVPVRHCHSSIHEVQRLTDILSAMYDLLLSLQLWQLYSSFF